MVKIRNFNEELENSLVKLGQEVLKKQETTAPKKETEREIVKEAIKSFAETAGIKTENLAVKRERNNGLLPDYVQEDKMSLELEAEISGLVKEVFESGLEKVLSEAKKHHPFVEDAFHDALADKLLPELKRRKII